MTFLIPHFNGVSPVDLHRIYGMNCYQYALGINSITLHFNKQTEELTYFALYPGHMTESVFERKRDNIPPCEAKQMTIGGCIEDGLKDIGEKSLADLPILSEKERLVALLFSFDRNDFHFLAYDDVAKTWKEKFPFLDVAEYKSFPEGGTGTYLPVRFFAAPRNIKPKGSLSGEHFAFANGVNLTIVEDEKQIKFGNRMSREKNGFRLLYNHQLYPAPDLSFINS